MKSHEIGRAAIIRRLACANVSDSERDSCKNYEVSSRRHRPSRKARREEPFVLQVAGASLFVGAMVFLYTPALQSTWHSATMSAEQLQAIEKSVYYRNCDAARAAGAAPIYRGSPGYRPEMDGDSDGIACEPFR